jgi:hypothetical protein
MDLLTRFKSKRAPERSSGHVASDVPLQQPAQQEAPAPGEVRAEEVAKEERGEVRAEEVAVSSIVGASECFPFGKASVSKDGGNGRGTLTEGVIAAIKEKRPLPLLKKFDTEWKKLSPEVAELCEELLAEGSPGAADCIGTAGRRGVSLEVCQQAAELWRTDNPKNWSRARDMLII